MSDLLSTTFLGGLAGTSTAAPRDLVALEAAIARAHAAGREAWPSVTVEPAVFATHLSECVPDDENLANAIEKMACADLYLACGCSVGDAAALAVFEREILPASDPAVARIDRSAEFASQVRDELRAHLLAPAESGPPRIARYLGRGPLRSWVQVAAIRLGYTLKRKVAAEKERPSSDEALLDAPWCEDPELVVARSELRVAFKAAFAEALAALSARERNVLRLYLLDGVSSEAIGQMYGAHRATVARWIASAHEALLAGTKKRLQKELRLAPLEVDSLVRWMSGQLEISISTVLRRSVPES